jgi:hypothetical protein
MQRHGLSALAPSGNRDRTGALNPMALLVGVLRYALGSRDARYDPHPDAS